VLYYAYGSNLDPVQMQARCPDAQVVGLGALHDHRLMFPRFSSGWEGGTAGVVPAHGATVWGVLFEVGEAGLAELDRYEGCRGPGDPDNAYDREQLTVELTRPDDGSIPRRVRAWAYVAHPANPSPPSRRYLDTILRGARHHRLPEEYVAALAATEAAP
jgi:gamma-glutamylcyclotransferase (GGCT)/AIG2-like uncharacterized protein YtfP